MMRRGDHQNDMIHASVSDLELDAALRSRDIVQACLCLDADPCRPVQQDIPRPQVASTRDRYFASPPGSTVDVAAKALQEA